MYFILQQKSPFLPLSLCFPTLPSFQETLVEPLVYSKQNDRH